MFKELDPLLHQQLRLAIISLLVSVKEADFVYIREQTGATAGNISVQLEKLQEAQYISIEKTFKGKRPQTICRITEKGIEAFENYVNALKEYIKK
jgi:DNA-binding MarR family transcriptional regulator